MHISGLSSCFALSFYRSFNASKWLVEALAENYRVELSSFGIESCIVEPGWFPTNFFDGLFKLSDTTREKS